MGQPAQLFDSLNQPGNREDLADIIWNVAPTETPFQMMMGRGRASARKHEWQTDTLATAAANAQVEGDDAVHQAQVRTVRIGNWSQISTKIIVVSGTQEVVDKAGRKSEMAYLLAKNGKELKRDMEFVLTQKGIGLEGDSTNPGTLASLESWYGTQAAAAPDTGHISADGTYVSAILVGGVPTTALVESANGTRALTESLLKGVIKAVWTNGGDAGVIMTGPFNKTVISAFTGNSTRFDKGEDKKLVTAIDIYVSDFGSHRIVPNRFSRDRTVHVLTMNLWSCDYLRAFKQIPLSITGDNIRRELLVEYTLRSSNEHGSGVVADLTTS